MNCLFLILMFMRKLIPCSFLIRIYGFNDPILKVRNSYINAFTYPKIKIYLLFFKEGKK